MNPLVSIYCFIRFAIDYVVDFVFGLYFNGSKQTIPQPQNKLVLNSATSLARKIRKGEITSEETVQAFIDRIKEVNTTLNAVVDDTFEDALEGARKIDADIRNGKITQDDFLKKPFLGVPFTSKESTMCQGLRTSYGLLSRKDEIGRSDAKVIELMKNAGGILIGVTNIPQLNRWVECYNPVYGTTKNPYNTVRNVGGSSGGEACIIAARGSPIGIGTDIGGSLRIPAFRCGVFGHKPTPEIISTLGLTFRTGTDDPTMVTAGPMSAHSEDLIPLLKVLLDNNVNQMQLDKVVDVKTIRIYYIAETTCFRSSPLPEEMKNLILKCVDHFNSFSETKPQKVEFEQIGSSFRFWSYMVTKEIDCFNKQIVNNEGEVNTFKEIVKYIGFQSEFTFYTLMNIMHSTIFPKPGEETAIKMDKLKNEIIKTLGDDGVLLFPSESYAAGYHYTSVLRPYNFSYYALWNALKFPATQVPLGLNAQGLPVGIQVVAAPFKDHLTLAVAKELERVFGGYVPPFVLDK